MKHMIRKINIDEIPVRVAYRNMLRQEIRDFLASDWPAAEIDTAKYKNAYNAAYSYGMAAKKMGVPVTAMSRESRAFLVKEKPEA